MKKKRIIPHEQLADYLDDKFTAKELATIADVTTQYAYDVKKGKSHPRVKVLNSLGIQVMYEVP